MEYMYVIYSSLFIPVCIYGYCWQQGHLRINAPYIYRSGAVVHGDLGIMIGLHRVNITLSGKTFYNQYNVLEVEYLHTIKKILSAYTNLLVIRIYKMFHVTCYLDSIATW